MQTTNEDWQLARVCLASGQFQQTSCWFQATISEGPHGIVLKGKDTNKYLNFINPLTASLFP